jgi:multidrug resistance efflux pump
MSKGHLVLTNIIGIVVIIALIAGGSYYYYQNINYVQTDEAKVSADMMQVVAPASGKLSGWNVKEGDNVSQEAVVGKVLEGQQAVSVKSTMSGTIIKSEAGNNQMVQQGQLLAQTADLNHLYITANVKETDLKDIQKGQSVDIIVDEDSNVTFKGTVEKIGYATNSVFSMLPQQSPSNNYTKVTQKVPVKISVQNPSAKVLPGMNAEVKIAL